MSRRLAHIGLVIPVILGVILIIYGLSIQGIAGSTTTYTGAGANGPSCPTWLCPNMLTVTPIAYTGSPLCPVTVTCKGFFSLAAPPNVLSSGTVNVYPLPSSNVNIGTSQYSLGMSSILNVAGVNYTFVSWQSWTRSQGNFTSPNWGTVNIQNVTYWEILWTPPNNSTVNLYPMYLTNAQIQTTSNPCGAGTTNVFCVPNTKGPCFFGGVYPNCNSIQVSKGPSNGWPFIGLGVILVGIPFIPALPRRLRHSRLG